eukprot:1160838-Pelagomonas_calceolata.AAC.3
MDIKVHDRRTDLRLEGNQNQNYRAGKQYLPQAAACKLSCKPKKERGERVNRKGNMPYNSVVVQYTVVQLCII